MVTSYDVELAILETLKAWLPAYLAEHDRQHGLDPGWTPAPRGWVLTGRTLQKLVSDQLPVVVLMNAGLTGPPRKEGPPGTYTATWAMQLGTLISAAWGSDSRQRAAAYSRAIQLALEQRGLAGITAAFAWTGELPDEYDFAGTRTYSATVLGLNVEVRNVAWSAGGPPPDAPPPDDPTAPWPPWVQVTETDISIDQVQEAPV